jgi:hypothetical protein
MEIKIIVTDYLLFIEFQLGPVRRTKRGETNYFSTQIYQFSGHQNFTS